MSLRYRVIVHDREDYPRQKFFHGEQAMADLQRVLEGLKPGTRRAIAELVDGDWIQRKEEDAHK